MIRRIIFCLLAAATLRAEELPSAEQILSFARPASESAGPDERCSEGMGEE